MNSDYAKAFRIVRAAAGLQQAELAGRLPITASQLSLIEAGKRRPSVETLDAVAKAVGIPASLITLLASTPEDIDRNMDRDVGDLARVLLRLLLGAGREAAE